MSIQHLTLSQTLLQSFSDVRCDRCGRLLIRWVPKGITTLNMKCPRCGMLDTVQLSTG